MHNIKSKIDWQSWLQRWDAQQTGYIPHREARFKVMLDVLEVQMPAEFVALDLACGPGAISQRLLERFPGARCVAFDIDPVLLAIGMGALGDVNGRLRWVEADLMADDWIELVGEAHFDAVLTTTALHWLPSDRLQQVYKQLAQLLRPGGLLLNGDVMPFPPSKPTLRQISKNLSARQEKEAFQERVVEDCSSWWEALAKEPELKELFQERDRRFGGRHTDHQPILDLHEAFLRDARFQEVGVIWQSLDDRVLLAVL
ncbi:class I SAM-dependent methyltransferase [Microseira wollei]|uniref:Methyltransferase type 12 n=1 Tax=Microseira wollei NIES-4236 TaxID=2530354 RepID=A0AAV3XEU5_9CYAN|nr:class I SAM-dependent methyltransferase [Microseira wollei]GET41093.1 methyltransferase type 12 [Microseira wollei NIES-4236]